MSRCLPASMLLVTLLSSCEYREKVNGSRLLEVTPNEASLGRGDSQTFAANAPVVWSVDEGEAGGTITAEGVFTAGETLGTVHVTAASAANSAIKTTVQVAVVPTLRLVAGQLGGAGSLDGAGDKARVASVTGMALHPSGDIYFTEYENHTVRKLTPANEVVTVAGRFGASGFIDAKGTDARFNHPTGIAVDGHGDVFVADTDNHRIRKIDAAGMVSTFTGAGAGFMDGSRGSALFNGPQGVAFDAAGVMYIADTGNGAIRTVAVDGKVSLWTNLTNTDLQGAVAFDRPRGIAIDPQGNFVITEVGGHRLRKITPQGQVSILAGSAQSVPGAANGKGTAAQFNSPSYPVIAADGTIYVSDSGNFSVRKVTLDGVVTTRTGENGVSGTVDGAASTARYGVVSGIALRTDGTLIIGDVSNTTIRAVSVQDVVTSIAGLRSGSGDANGTGSAAHFNAPRGIALDSGDTAYVADGENFAVRTVSASGKTTTLAGKPRLAGFADSPAAPQFRSLDGVAFTQSGLYVVDVGNGLLRRVAFDGGVTSPGRYRGTGRLPGCFEMPDVGTDGIVHLINPRSVAVLASGQIIFGLPGRGLICNLDPEGGLDQYFGVLDQAGKPSMDGDEYNGTINNLSGLATTGDVVLVADSAEHVIRRIVTMPALSITTVTGKRGEPGLADGKGAEARFNKPGALAVGADGLAYVADVGNHAVRTMTPDGRVATLIGAAGQAGVRLGPLPAALNRPAGLAVASNGDVYITDEAENCVLRIH